MAKRKSNNAYYRSPDITGIVNNLSTAMGMKGNADSNYLTDLNKMARLEGTTLDNREKSETWDALAAMFDTMTPEEKYQGTLALRNFSLNRSKQQTEGLQRQFKVATEKHKARKGRHEADQAGFLATLAKSIANMGGQAPTTKGIDTGRGHGRDEFSADAPLSDDALEGAMQRFAALSPGGPHTITSDPLGKQGKQITEGKVGVYSAREALLEAQKEGYEKLNVEKVNQVIKAAEKIIAETEVLKDIGIERRNQIVQKTLDDVNENIETIKNLKDMNKLIKERILTEGQRLRGEGFKAKTAELIAGAKGGELYLDKRALEEKLNILKQKLMKETDNAKIASLNEEFARTLKQYEVETAKSKKDTAGFQKGTAEVQKGTAEIKKDTATAQKEKAVTLSEMSVMEKEALGPEILAKATKIEAQIRETEQKIELAKARTEDEYMARNVKILQKANWNNRNRLQQLLSPHLQKYAEQRAANEAGEFAQQTKNIMLKDKLKQQAKKGTDTVNIDPDSSWLDWTTWFNSMDVNKQEYSEISSQMFKHKDKIQSGAFPEVAKNEIIADIIKSLQVKPKQAQKIYEYTLKSFGK